MAKVLIAVRLPVSGVKLLKDLVVSEGKSQAEIVLLGLELVRMKSLYKPSEVIQEKEGVLAQEVEN